jgi:hypothetical protein
MAELVNFKRGAKEEAVEFGYVGVQVIEYVTKQVEIYLELEREKMLAESEQRERETKQFELDRNLNLRKLEIDREIRLTELTAQIRQSETNNGSAEIYRQLLFP